jgi:hypothetical protein
MVILEMGNPKVANVAVALVGAKVSLFYIPLLVVTATMLKSEGDAVTLLRTMIALVPIPCIVGLIQYFGSNAFGHQETISAFYGPGAAAAATQGFSSFDYGGTLYRIPSTFVSVAHYFGYIEHSLCRLMLCSAVIPRGGGVGTLCFCSCCSSPQAFFLEPDQPSSLCRSCSF